MREAVDGAPCLLGSSSSCDLYQKRSLVILEHLSVLWPLKHFVGGIKTRLFIYVPKLCGVYEFRYTPEQPAPYSPNRREVTLSETLMQPIESLCVKTREKGRCVP